MQAQSMPWSIAAAGREHSTHRKPAVTLLLVVLKFVDLPLSMTVLLIPSSIIAHCELNTSPSIEAIFIDRLPSTTSYPSTTVSAMKSPSLDNDLEAFPPTVRRKVPPQSLS